MGNDTSYDNDHSAYPQRFSSASNSGHHSKRSTMIKPPNLSDYPTPEYSKSHSISHSKSKSKTKSKSGKKRSSSKSKSTVTPTLSHHLSLPDIHTEIQSNNSSSTVHNSPRNGNMMQYQSEKIDLTKIQNGITNHYINARVVKIAAEFWEEHISYKSLPEKLVCHISHHCEKILDDFHFVTLSQSIYTLLVWQNLIYYHFNTVD